MDDDGGGAGGADFGGLPVAFAADFTGYLAGDLGFGGDLDERGFGRWQLVGAGEKVSEDGLKVAVGEETTRDEVGCG